MTSLPLSKKTFDEPNQSGQRRSPLTLQDRPASQTRATTLPQIRPMRPNRATAEVVHAAEGHNREKAIATRHKIVRKNTIPPIPLRRSPRNANGNDSRPF